VTVGVFALLVAGVMGVQQPGTGIQQRGIDRSAVGGSSAASSAPAPVAGSDLTIYLMTMGMGDQVWERFGHNAIRIVDASRGTDSVYNWGTFDFHQPNFIGRFMTGNTLYWMQGDGMAETMATYQYLNRSVWVQELNLTPAERVAVRDFIAWNALPEHRYYRYDYYLDNCSTRVRDVIDRIVGGQLKAAIAPRLTSTTYRFHTQRALQFDRAVAMGTNIGLGEVADRPITQWEEAFLPSRLQQHIRGVQIRATDGTVRPLVKNEQEMFAARRAPEPTAPPDDTVRNLVIGLSIAGILVLLARAARRGRRAGRVTFATVGTIWAALNGLLGVILIVGWTATRHVFMARNENLLQFDPLSLVLAVTLPLALSRARATGLTRQFSAAIAIVALVGLAMKALPWFDQVNVAVIVMTLPVHLALAWGVRMLVPDTVPARPAAAARAVASRSAA
jgi:hypothetical protein